VWASPADDSCGGWRKSLFGISVKPGLWTGLDYGLDWTHQNSCIQTANATKFISVCPQLCLNLRPFCWVLEASSSRFPRGQRSLTTTLNKGGSGWLVMGSVNGFGIHDLYLLFRMEATYICWESTFINLSLSSG